MTRHMYVGLPRAMDIYKLRYLYLCRALVVRAPVRRAPHVCACDSVRGHGHKFAQPVHGPSDHDCTSKACRNMSDSCCLSTGGVLQRLRKAVVRLVERLRPQRLRLQPQAGADDVIICGDGVIGASIAYHLARLGQRCTVVECNGIATGTTSAAGAGIVLDAFDGTPMEQLMQVTFARHVQLAQELKGTGYQCAFSSLMAYTLSVTCPRDQKRVHSRADCCAVLSKKPKRSRTW